MKGKKSGLKKAKKAYKKTVKMPMLKNIDTALTVINKEKPRVIKFRRSLINNNNQFSVFTAPQTLAGGNMFAQPANASTENTYSALLGFSIRDIPNFSEFCNLFSKIRLTKVKVSLTGDDLASPEYPNPTVYMWKNNDITLISSGITATTVAQAPNVTRYQFSHEHRVVSKTVIPYLVDDVSFSNNTFSASSQIYNRWLDCSKVLASSPSPTYYSLGLYFTNIIGQTLGAINFGVDCEYTVECMESY